MKRLIYFILGLLVASCYDDKENYTYQEVNTLDVSLNKVYSVRLDKDTTVTIIPQLSQSLQENEDNLEYTWLHSTTNHNFYGHGKFDTVGSIFSCGIRKFFNSHSIRMKKIFST